MKELPVINTDRRGFLKTTCAALCTLPLAAILSGCETDITKVIPSTGESLVIDLKTESGLATVGGAIQKAFPPVNSGAMLNIIRTTETTFLVVTSVCTHQGCTVPLPGENDEGSPDMVCPCHAAKFDAKTGAVLRGPAESNLRSFENVYDATANTLTIKY